MRQWRETKVQRGRAIRGDRFGRSKTSLSLPLRRRNALGLTPLGAWAEDMMCQLGAGVGACANSALAQPGGGYCSRGEIRRIVLWDGRLRDARGNPARSGTVFAVQNGGSGVFRLCTGPCGRSLIVRSRRMTIKEANTERKWLPCLRCGRSMWTDRCHRVCRRCRIAIGRLKYRIPRSYAMVRDSFRENLVTEDAV